MVVTGKGGGAGRGLAHVWVRTQWRMGAATALGAGDALPQLPVGFVAGGLKYIPYLVLISRKNKH